MTAMRGDVSVAILESTGAVPVPRATLVAAIAAALGRDPGEVDAHVERMITDGIPW